MRGSSALRLWSVIFVVVFAATACTSGPSSSSGSSQGSSSSSQGTLNSVLASKTLRVGVVTGDPPYDFIGTNGELQGYDIDLANLLAKDLGVSVVFTKTDLAGRVTALTTGKVDVEFGDFTYTPKRAQVVAFTDPYLISGFRMLTRAQDNFTSFADLNHSNIKIGAPRGSIQIPELPKYFPNAQIVQFSGPGDQNTALSTGQIQAASDGAANVGDLIKAQPGFYKVVGPILIPFEDNIGLRHGDFDWYLYLNSFVRQINEDGSNYALWAKYVGGPPAPFIQQGPNG